MSTNAQAPTTVRLSAEVTWPANEAATQTEAIIGRKGSGKTYLAGKGAEQLILAGCQTIILDPVGNWSGLRLAADGKGPGLPILVLGGMAGDIALGEDEGEQVAVFLLKTGASAVLDVSAYVLLMGAAGMSPPRGEPIGGELLETSSEWPSRWQCFGLGFFCALGWFTAQAITQIANFGARILVQLFWP